MIKHIRSFTIIFLLTLTSCGGSGDGPGSGGTFGGTTGSSSWDDLTLHTVTDFEVINSCNDPLRFDILIPDGYSGSLSYIAATKDLAITTKTEFDVKYAAAVTKGTTTITADSLLYNNYIKTGSIAYNKACYIYLLDKDDNVSVFTGTTLTSDGPVSNPAAETGTVGGLSYTITYPDGYDKNEAETWPLILSLKANNFTSDNKKLPCITFQVSSTSFSSAQVTAIETKLTAILGDTANYKINHNKIYGIGYSAGGDAVMDVAGYFGSGSSKFKAVVATGVSHYETSFDTTLDDVNIWLFCGDSTSGLDEFADTTIAFYNSCSGHTTVDLQLTEMAGLNHSESRNPPLLSPYTFLWLLSK